MVKNQSPLERLVRQAFADHPGKKQRFAQSLGYKNLNNAFALIYCCLRSGVDQQNILRNIQKIFKIDEWNYDEAWHTTKILVRQQTRIAQLEEDLEQQKKGILARKNFRPYIYVKTSESRPTCSITIYAFVNLGKFRYVFLPYQILQNSDEYQKMKVGEIIRKHFLESDGKCPGMGSITDYFYRNSYDSFWEFDTEGDFVNSSIGNFFESHALAMYNNKTIAETPV